MDLLHCLNRLCARECKREVEVLYHMGEPYVSWRSALAVLLTRHWHVAPLELSDAFSLEEGDKEFEVPCLMRLSLPALVRGTGHEHDWALWLPEKRPLVLGTGEVIGQQTPAALYHCNEIIPMTDYPFTSWCPLSTIYPLD